MFISSTRKRNGKFSKLFTTFMKHLPSVKLEIARGENVRVGYELEMDRKLETRERAARNESRGRVMGTWPDGSTWVFSERIRSAIARRRLSEGFSSNFADYTLGSSGPPLRIWPETAGASVWDGPEITRPITDGEVIRFSASLRAFAMLPLSLVLSPRRAFSRSDFLRVLRLQAGKSAAAAVTQRNIYIYIYPYPLIEAEISPHIARVAGADRKRRDQSGAYCSVVGTTASICFFRFS